MGLVSNTEDLKIDCWESSVLAYMHNYEKDNGNTGLPCKDMRSGKECVV